MKRKLPNITLFGLDCINIERLIQAAEICQKSFDFGDVKFLTSLQSDHKNIVRVNPINSTEQYSRFIISELDEYIKTPFALVIQYDGFILNPDAWTDEFLNYDYIGAPWLADEKMSVEKFGFPKELVGKWVVGNGGFSLRSKKLISLSSKLFKDGQFTKYHPEDVALGVYYRTLLENNGIKFAPVELAKKFSLEANEEDGTAWTNQFGFHGLNWTDISKWLKEHPEYKINNPLDSWALGVKEKFKNK